MEWLLFTNIEYEGGWIERFGDNRESAEESYRLHTNVYGADSCILIYGDIVKGEENI